MTFSVASARISRISSKHETACSPKGNISCLLMASLYRNNAVSNERNMQIDRLLFAGLCLFSESAFPAEVSLCEDRESNTFANTVSEQPNALSRIRAFLFIKC